MSCIGNNPGRARVRALALILLCGSALGATGPAPSTNPATNRTAGQIQQAAIENALLRRPTAIVPTTNEARTSASSPPVVDMKRVGLSLGLVLGVIFMARFAMKKMFPAVSVGRNSQVIRVVSRSVVGPKQQFLLVKLGKRLVLVGDSGSSMNPLAEISDPAEVAELVGQLQSESTHSSASAFASIFRKAETQFEPEPSPVPEATQTHTEIVRRELLADAPEQVPAQPDQELGLSDRQLVAVASEINGLMDRARQLANRVRGS